MKELFDFLDGLQKEVNEASEKLNGVKSIEAIFDGNFMKAHTDYDNFQKWLSAGGFNLEDWDTIVTRI